MCSKKFLSRMRKERYTGSSADQWNLYGIPDLASRPDPEASGIPSRNPDPTRPEIEIGTQLCWCLTLFQKLAFS
uniref:Uncharacterized protein n=1 Tax=Steinernema glaseri TaxID=37863 RepID=A0A1I7ZKB3_9BILA